MNLYKICPFFAINSNLCAYFATKMVTLDTPNTKIFYFQDCVKNFPEALLYYINSQIK